MLVSGLPKTGTTALAAAIRAGVGGNVAFEPSTVDQVLAVEDCRIVKIVYPPNEERTLAEVMRAYHELNRRIWIVRDPRDQLVSAFLYTWFRGHHMPVDRFHRAIHSVRRREAGERFPFMQMLYDVFGTDTYIFQTAYYGHRLMTFVRSEEAKRTLFYRYSDLVADRFDPVSAYLGVEIRSSEVDEKHQRVVRTKADGGWRSWFLPEDREAGVALFGDYMKATGQAQDWMCSDMPPDPRHGSWYMAWLWAGGVGPRPQSEEECQALLDSVSTT